jgi:DNA polymerase III alpha subunit (gram-positive type)
LYKIHHPLAFYATYFTVRPDAIEAHVAVLGKLLFETECRNSEKWAMNVPIR